MREGLSFITRELRRLRTIAKRLAIAFLLTFFAVTALPITWSGLFVPPSALGWVGDSLAVHTITWLEGYLLPAGETILVLGPFDAWGAIMLVGLYLSLLVTIPYGVSLALGFLEEGLYPRERRAVRRLIALSTVLFALGILFAFVAVLPPIYLFAFELQGPVNAVGSVSLAAFLQTTFAFALGLGLAFEIPTVCYGLAQLELLTTSLMRKYWRHAIVVCFLIAFVISPGIGGGTVEVVIALSLSLLYGASYYLVRRVETVRQRRLHPEPAVAIAQTGE
ncbi:MAG TPA: twin-arginine translocase subunit TatC [Thermoplasmata archaeon]|nr:twin-arginine translocase subunit TatC [Thermoplasmata archaeon]